MIEREPPYAEVEQIGRFTYRVTVHHGALTWGPDGYGWHVLGKKRATRKAARMLRRYLAVTKLETARRNDIYRVHARDTRR